MKHVLAYSPNIEYSSEESYLERFLFRNGERVSLSGAELTELNKAGIPFSEKALVIKHLNYILACEGENLAIFQL
jgi:hypothetical protein